MKQTGAARNRSDRLRASEVAAFWQIEEENSSDRER